MEILLEDLDFTRLTTIQVVLRRLSRMMGTQDYFEFMEFVAQELEQMEEGRDHQDQVARVVERATRIRRVNSREFALQKLILEIILSQADLIYVPASPEED